MKQIHNIIIKPIITEQSLKDVSMGQYTFAVAKSRNKTEIKNAIEKLFEVNVVKITTNITKGSTVKNTRLGKRTSVYADKKARVMLAKGQSIDIFEENVDRDSKDKKKKGDKDAK